MKKFDTDKIFDKLFKMSAVTDEKTTAVLETILLKIGAKNFDPVSDGMIKLELAYLYGATEGLDNLFETFDALTLQAQQITSLMQAMETAIFSNRNDIPLENYRAGFIRLMGELQEITDELENLTDELGERKHIE